MKNSDKVVHFEGMEVDELAGTTGRDNWLGSINSALKVDVLMGCSFTRIL